MTDNLFYRISNLLNEYGSAYDNYKNQFNKLKKLKYKTRRDDLIYMHSSMIKDNNYYYQEISKLLDKLENKLTDDTDDYFDLYSNNFENLNKLYEKLQNEVRDKIYIRINTFCEVKFMMFLLLIIVMIYYKKICSIINI